MEFTDTREMVLKFLNNNFVMNIATTDGLKPSASVVVYVIDEHLNFYFVTHKDSYKTRHLINNPHISFSIWEFHKMSIQADGTTAVVENEAEKEWVMNAFGDAATKDPNFWAPIFRIKGGEYVLFKITPHWMRMLDLSRNTVRQHESPFTEIEL
jgi:uncharacterized pyridoxamine 5'-phosphate oxidase family protein